MKAPILNNCFVDPNGYHEDQQCRQGTVDAGINKVREILGPPRLEDWSAEGIDGAGKVHISWFIKTPRGYVEVYDYWWNPADVLSIGGWGRNTLWAVKWLRLQGIPARLEY